MFSESKGEVHKDALGDPGVGKIGENASLITRKRQMKMIKPDYYDKFQCTAEKCPFTCCQEWKIAVDDATAKKWKYTAVPDSVSVQKKRKSLQYFTTCQDGARVIVLDREHLCPFFNQDKLCELVLTYGNQILSRTCDIFPREIHTYRNREEYTLMPSCPAVVDLLRECEGFSLTEELAEKLIDKKDSANAREVIREDEQEQILLKLRDFFLELMSKKEISVETSFLMVYYLALDLLKREHMSKETVAEYQQSTVLEELRNAIEEVEPDSLEAFEEQNELFLDLAENYRRKGMYQKWLEKPAELAEDYAAGYDEAELKEKLYVFAKEWEKQEDLFRSLLCEEIFAECFSPETEMEDTVIKLQWLAMEYAAIRHILFLTWDREGRLAYEDVRDAIVLIFRMMGYEDEDIYEYLETGFESLIWEWGYLALILGRPKGQGG